MTDPDQNALYPFEVVVEGTPVSLQGSSRSRDRWKAVVTEACRQRARNTDELGFLYPAPVDLTIFYFAPAPMAGDIDNIVKPIMDALVAVAYPNDKLVERVLVQKFEPGVNWIFSDPSNQLALALDISPPVVYIRVRHDLSWRQLQ